MNTAHEIADKLNEYEDTHTAEDRNIWSDLIRGLDEYDDEATDEADPNYESDVVVLAGGARIEHREGEWVVA